MATRKNELATELKDLDVDRVDGVDRPATGRAFALYKHEGDKTMATFTEAQVQEIMKNYATVATAADMLLKALRKDAAGKVSKSTAIAVNGLAQIMGAEPVFVSKAVPTQPYEISENVDGDKRGPADENIGGNFTPRSMPGSMVGKVQFFVKGVEKAGACPMVEGDEPEKPKMPWDEAKMSKMIEDSVAKCLSAQKIETAKTAEPVAKAEDKKPVAPASKQVELDETQVKVRKDAGFRFGSDFSNVVFG